MFLGNFIKIFNFRQNFTDNGKKVGQTDYSLYFPFIMFFCRVFFSESVYDFILNKMSR